ncbi:MAG: hypothetical protein OCC46_13750 [Pseudodesulfovibrio sp.]
MGSVVALDEFRRSIRYGGQKPKSPPRPKISGGEIWGRNYNEVEAIVFGLLKVRGIVAHHTGEHDKAFDQLCMISLQAAYSVESGGTANLKEAIRPLKEWILDETTDENKRDMSWALVIIDLIEKSPTK